MGRDSSVGIAIRYGLDGPGIESRWGRDFPHSVQTRPGAHPASYTMGTGSLPEVKRPGRGADHPPPPSTEVKGRIELYFYSLSGLSWPVLGWPLPLPNSFCKKAAKKCDTLAEVANCIVCYPFYLLSLCFIAHDVWKKHRYSYMYMCSLLILCLEFHVTRTEIKFSWSFLHPPRKRLNIHLLNPSNNKHPPCIISVAACFQLLPCVAVCDAVYHTGSKQLFWEAWWLLLSEESEGTGKLKGTAVTQWLRCCATNRKVAG